MVPGPSRFHLIGIEPVAAGYSCVGFICAGFERHASTQRSVVQTSPGKKPGATERRSHGRLSSDALYRDPCFPHEAASNRM